MPVLQFLEIKLMPKSKEYGITVEIETTPLFDNRLFSFDKETSGRADQSLKLDVEKYKNMLKNPNIVYSEE